MKQIIDAMYEDSGVRLAKLKVDGGMANNKLFLQMLANIVGINVSTPSLCETTALGVALAAGKAKGIDLFQLEDENEIRSDLSIYLPQIQGRGELKTFCSIIVESILMVILERERSYAEWKRAVLKSFERSNSQYSTNKRGTTKIRRENYCFCDRDINHFNCPLITISEIYHEKYHLSSGTVAWMTLASVFTILVYMISRRD